MSLSSAGHQYIVLFQLHIGILRNKAGIRGWVPVSNGNSPAADCILVKKPFGLGKVSAAIFKVDAVAHDINGDLFIERRQDTERLFGQFICLIVCKVPRQRYALRQRICDQIDEHQSRQAGGQKGG